MYLNKVTLIGNLTRDPELKALPGGTQVCSFSIATNETFKDKSGAKQERVEFHNIVCFGKTAENVSKYMKKGSQIYIDGKLQTRSWDDKTSGEKRYRTEILANAIQFGSKPQGSARPQGEERIEPDTNDPSQYPADGNDINPEDIPF